VDRTRLRIAAATLVNAAERRSGRMNKSDAGTSTAAHTPRATFLNQGLFALRRTGARESAS
jgi:hypothetical protein